MRTTTVATIVLVLPTIGALPARVDAEPHPSRPAGATGSIGAGSGDGRADQGENVTVFATRPHVGLAPTPGYGSDRAPWEIGTAIHDTMTGADTSAFGNAYNLGSPLGSDERSNETGGSLVAPRHDGNP